MRVRATWQLRTGCLPGCVPWQQGPHEGPLVTEHAATVVPDAVRLDEVRVAAEQDTVLLIGGEAGEAEQRQGLIAGSLGRQEVAVVLAGSMTYSTTQVIMPQASGALPAEPIARSAAEACVSRKH